MSLLSIEKTTAWIKDKALLESCHQLYRYVNDAFDDMFKNPTENYFDPFDPALDIILIPTIIADHLTFHTMILTKFLGAASIIENEKINIPPKK